MTGRGRRGRRRGTVRGMEQKKRGKEGRASTAADFRKPPTAFDGVRGPFAIAAECSGGSQTTSGGRGHRGQRTQLAGRWSPTNTSKRRRGSSPRSAYRACRGPDLPAARRAKDAPKEAFGVRRKPRRVSSLVGSRRHSRPRRRRRRRRAAGAASAAAADSALPSARYSG